MNLDLDFDGPLPTLSVSFVVDPDLGGSVEKAYELPLLHSPTAGPNRYTVHVPTETTRLSLGQKSARWDTDTGITGHTESHIHFETKATDTTIVSLGGPATTTGILGHPGADAKPKQAVPPKSTKGYAMVTSMNAWHDAKHQHYLISHTEDMSLRTSGSEARAVVQADAGKIDLNGGKEVNVSGGGVSIAAGELEVEDVGYDEAWEGRRPHSSAAGATQIAAAVAASLSAAADFIANKVRTKYKEGDFAGAPEEMTDKHKRKINGALLLLSLKKVYALVSEPKTPEKCVKLAAPDIVAATAGGDVSVFGMKGVALGSAGWTGVNAGMSASMKATLFGGVGGMFTGMKGYRKVEMGSDWGKIFVAAETEIHLQGEKDFTAGAKSVAHVASPDGEALLGGKKTWFGTPAGGGYGLLLDDQGLALGAASGADKMSSAKIKDQPALRMTSSSIEAKTSDTSLELGDDKVTMTGKNKKIRFESTSGPVTVNGARILLK
ncbi:Hypothetical protein A7982_02578 [Minicystis rosea]|nr:Hypothetical protein A7982_02578 [Minicystis rosea]